MKQVLIISASPRKNGNSDLLCDQFAQGAKESGHHVEKVFLTEKQIGYCRGCGVCNTTHVCVQKDDMAEILDKMVKADVIVLATPVYFYGRTTENVHRPHSSEIYRDYKQGFLFYTRSSRH